MKNLFLFGDRTFFSFFWRLPEKKNLNLFFREHLPPVSFASSIPVFSLVRVCLSSKGLSLTSDFFVSLASSLVSSTPPLIFISCYNVKTYNPNQSACRPKQGLREGVSGGTSYPGLGGPGRVQVSALSFGIVS